MSEPCGPLASSSRGVTTIRLRATKFTRASAEGIVVDAIGYPKFFVYTATLGIPALVLLYFVVRQSERAKQAAAPLEAQSQARQN